MTTRRRRFSRLQSEVADHLVRETLIGKGTFGHVWRAHSTRQPGVVFVVKDVGITTKKQQRMAANEGLLSLISLTFVRCVHGCLTHAAEVLAGLSHPHIVRLWGYWTAVGTMSLVMELADHGDVYRRIGATRDRREVVPEVTVTNWIAQTGSALAYIHDRGILHRDIKPHNLLLTASDSVKLGDFGVVRVLEEGTSSADPLDRRCMTPIGSPMYLPPEVCHGTPYGSKADMWALGCVIFEVMTLRPACSAANLRLLLARIKTGVPDGEPSPDTYSQGLRDVTAGLLRLDCDARLSATDMLQLAVIAPLAPMLDCWVPPACPFAAEDYFSAPQPSPSAPVAVKVPQQPDAPDGGLDTTTQAGGSQAIVVSGGSRIALCEWPSLAPSIPLLNCSAPLTSSVTVSPPFEVERVVIVSEAMGADVRRRAVSPSPPSLATTQRTALADQRVAVTLSRLSPGCALSRRQRAVSLPPPLSALSAVQTATDAAARAASLTPPPLSPSHDRWQRSLSPRSLSPRPTAGHLRLPSLSPPPSTASHRPPDSPIFGSPPLATDLLSVPTWQVPTSSCRPIAQVARANFLDACSSHPAPSSVSAGAARRVLPPVHVGVNGGRPPGS